MIYGDCLFKEDFDDTANSNFDCICKLGYQPIRQVEIWFWEYWTGVFDRNEDPYQGPDSQPDFNEKQVKYLRKKYENEYNEWKYKLRSGQLNDFAKVEKNFDWVKFLDE